MSSPHLCLRFGLALVFVVGFASTLQAQTGLPRPRGFGLAPQWSAGYVINAPSQMLGFSTMFMGPPLGRWGVYLDAKFTMESPTDEPGYDPAETVGQAEQRGDDLFSSESVWQTFNVGAVRAMTPSLALYAGLGYSRESAYREYFNPARDRGEFGFYWVDDDDGSGSRINVFGGVWLHVVGNLMFQVGAESAPRGFTVGAAYILPLVR